MSWLVVYAVVGLVVALIAAYREYDDGAAPGSVLSAGAVGLFSGMFWPAIVIVLLIGGAVGRRHHS